MEFGAWYGVDQESRYWESTGMGLDLTLSLRQLKKGSGMKKTFNRSAPEAHEINSSFDTLL